MNPPPPYPAHPDPILTPFWPDFDPKSPQEVKIGSNSGQNRVKKGWKSGRGERGMGVGGHRGRSGSVAPPESRDPSNRFSAANYYEKTRQGQVQVKYAHDEGHARPPASVDSEGHEQATRIVLGGKVRQSEELRWHVCRAKFGMKCVLNYEFSYEKCSKHVPELLEPFFVQGSLVYPYPSVSDLAEGNSDHGPGKTRTKTQTTPDSVFTRERRNSDHGLSFWVGETQTMVWVWGVLGVGVDEGALICGSEKSGKIPAKFPCQDSNKIHRP